MNTSASAAVSPRPEIPDYQLLRSIGGGAYGEVWLARSLATGASRAVKIVRRATFTDERPFNREFDGIKKFEEISRSHPSQLALFHVGRNDAAGCFYYVMELADDANKTPTGAVSHSERETENHSQLANPSNAQKGPSAANVPLSPGGEGWGKGARLSTQSSRAYAPHTLRSDLAHGRIPAARVLELGLALTEALAHLHSHGLVHRDIKPSNIIFVGGRPKLADIGLVTDASDQCSVVGTEGYIAPEGPGAPPADIFALGKVLYEALTGLDRRRYPEMPAEIRDWPDRTLVFELNEIILKTCAADARQRYASTETMLADLRHLAEGRSVKRRRTWKQTRRLMLRLIAPAALVITTWLLFFRFNNSTLQRFNASVPTSIFILPFRSEATNGNDNGLAARATDAFIESLKQIKSVTVAPRREELGRRPESEARAEAAKLFAVRYVLAGSVRTDDSTTLALTLHDLVSDRTAWSQSFTGATEHLPSMEMEAIRALANALGVVVTPEAEQRIGQKLSNNLAAWRVVQQADKLSMSGLGRDYINAKLQRYNEALDIDPDYIGALIGKAQFLRNQAGDREPIDIWPEIKTCARRMLQIDPTSSVGQYFLWANTFLFEWDWQQAERIFQERRARGLDWPVMTAIYLRMVGRFDEAQIEQDKVKDLDQRNEAVRNHSAAAAYMERDYRKTIEMAHALLVVFPESVAGSDWLFHAYYHLAQYELALETIRQRRKVFDDPSAMAVEACALAKLGHGNAARKILSDLAALSANRYVDAYPLAWIHLALGEKHAALAKLRKAYEKRSEYLVFAEILASGLRFDPKLDELRDEPEFHDLLKLTGLDVWPKPERIQ